MSNVIIILGCRTGYIQDNDGNILENKIRDDTHMYYRVTKGFEIYNRFGENCTIICSGNYGEATMMRKFLLDMNINDKNIIVENESRNTIENCINTFKLLNKLNITPTNINVVTNDYHIKRTKIIFEHYDKLNTYSAKIFYNECTVPNNVETVELYSKFYENEEHNINNYVNKRLEHYDNMINKTTY